MRRARMLVWVNPNDCRPPHGLDLESKHDNEKVAYLTKCFQERGFSRNFPAMVGYVVDGKIQLLSGTHRHLAAIRAGIDIPVTLWLRSDVESTWGTDLWSRVIADIPVYMLEMANVEEGPRLSPYERVSFEE